jgi:pimeloyl-ACP methyl ester carboxylesterase
MFLHVPAGTGFGTVTMPDLPGFGGMDSFYKIDEMPDLDTMADYLASFIKLRYKRQRFVVVGFSYGFVVLTRMLQRYPDLTRRVDLVISLAGMAHNDDFSFSRTRRMVYLTGSRFFSGRLSSRLYKNIVLHPSMIKMFYSRSNSARPNFADLTPEQKSYMNEFEVRLWRQNDLRTHMATVADLLTFNNCQRYVGLPVYHVAVPDDPYVNNRFVEQHLRVIFSNFHMFHAAIPKHIPVVLSDKREAAVFLPAKLRKLLLKKA